ncbi:MAG: hypothetical protein FWE54_07445 [Methanimicrococcus sp.]|nr:hypothetical protein [Methanimicrococcus sp.]
MNKSKSVLKILLLILTAVLILAALPGFMTSALAAQAALAADYEVASQQDLIGALRAGDAVTITTTSDFTITEMIANYGCTLEIGHAITINSGTTINNGSIIINSGGSITINNGSVMNNGGTIYNSDGGRITNNGRVYNSGVIDNSGIISNTGTFIGTIPAGNGTFTDNGIYTQDFAHAGNGTYTQDVAPAGNGTSVVFSFDGNNTPLPAKNKTFIERMTFEHIIAFAIIGCLLVMAAVAAVVAAIAILLRSKIEIVE